jgi:hypothetical protein
MRIRARFDRWYFEYGMRALHRRDARARRKRLAETESSAVRAWLLLHAPLIYRWLSGRSDERVRRTPAQLIALEGPEVPLRPWSGPPACESAEFRAFLDSGTIVGDSVRAAGTRSRVRVNAARPTRTSSMTLELVLRCMPGHVRPRVAEEYQAQLAALALSPARQRAFVLSTLFGIVELRRAVAEGHELGVDGGRAPLPASER